MFNKQDLENLKKLIDSYKECTKFKEICINKSKLFEEYVKNSQQIIGQKDKEILELKNKTHNISPLIIIPLLLVGFVLVKH